LRRRSSANALLTSFSTQSLLMALFERISSTLSRTRMAASIASQVFAPIGRSCGATQQRTPVFCRSACRRLANASSLDELLMKQE
jgi:hypothetical protein